MDNLDQATQSLPVSDARINSLDAEYFGTWTFSTLVRGDEWNPALFTDVLKDCAPKLGTTLQKAKILSYACRDKSTIVPDGYVPVEGYLIMQSPNKVRRGTLRRCMLHQNLR